MKPLKTVKTNSYIFEGLWPLAESEEYRYITIEDGDKFIVGRQVKVQLAWNSDVTMTFRRFKFGVVPGTIVNCIAPASGVKTIGP